MKPSTYIPFLLFVVTCFSACKRENTIPILSISPALHDVDVVSGDVVSFGIGGRSDNSTLAHMIIQSKRGNGFTTTMIDSVLSGTTFNWTWEYQVAHSTEDYMELLTFILVDANGEQMSTTRALYVTLGETVLVETSGHLFYSPNSAIHAESAFDVEERVQVIYNVDSVRRDIQDTTEAGGDVLSRSWVSPAGGRFVRFNGFDYANATDVSVRNAFNSGVPAEQMNNIAVGDVIITRLGSKPPNVGFYAVLRIMDVVDEGLTADNDRYVFNMKWASFTE